MELTSTNVEKIFAACLQDEHLENDNEPVDLIMHKAYLNTTGHEADIKDMLDQLEDSFKTTGGGGMSFLQACYTKAGIHWGEHDNMAKLFGLGISAGLAKWTMPREMWDILPGAMPYVSILDTSEKWKSLNN